jgi:hypothetical protein
MSDILLELQRIGYEVRAQAGEVRLRWRREEPPRRELVLPLLEEAKRRKGEILAALAMLARTVDGDQAPARTPTPWAHEPADAGPRTVRASTPRAPEATVSKAAHRDRQGASLDMPGFSPDEDVAESSASTDATVTEATGACEAIPFVDLTRCGWCGSTQLWWADTGSGRVYCRECHGVYNPSQPCWSPGESGKHRRV